MGKMKMTLEFDSQNKTYYAGQSVTGRLLVQLPKPKSFRNITLVCEGEAHVRFRKRRTSRRRGRSRYYTGDEKYFKNTLMVAGGASGETELQAGEHHYTFSFPLPQYIPSSFEGTHGYIRYTVKAKMDRAWKIFGHDSKTAFTVLSPVDLNALPTVQNPVLAETSKSFLLRSGSLEMRVQLPCSGFVPGQTIPINIDVNNTSSVLVKHVHCLLYKETTYTARQSFANRQKEEKDVIVNVKIDETVEPLSSKTLYQTIKIPPVPPSQLHNCSIIDLRYFCEVQAVVEGILNPNVKERIPITIGTVPLYSKMPVPSKPASASGSGVPPECAPPVPDPSTAPSAPELPPPSYEESVYGIRVKAESPEEGENLTNYAPRYPVWNFDVKQ